MTKQNPRAKGLINYHHSHQFYKNQKQQGELKFRTKKGNSVKKSNRCKRKAVTIRISTFKICLLINFLGIFVTHVILKVLHANEQYRRTFRGVVVLRVVICRAGVDFIIYNFLLHLNVAGEFNFS